MRKIKTEEELERSKKRNNLLVGGFLIFLLVFSLGAYSMMSRDDPSDSSRVTEKGITFYHNGAYWQAEIEGQIFSFENLPSEVENISVNGYLNLGQYASQPLYVVNPTTESYAILGNLQNYLLRWQEVCAFENCTKDLPVKDCELDNVLIFEPEAEEEININGSCVYIRGNGPRLSDAFLYEVLNIN